MLVVLFYSRNAKVEISSIPVSPNACDATLAPLSYCEPGLTLCKGCSLCGALVLVYDRQSLTVYSLVDSVLHILPKCTIPLGSHSYYYAMQSLLCARMRSKVMHLVALVYRYVYIFICMSTKNRLLITALLTASACAALCKPLLKQVDKNLYKRFLLEFIDK